MSNTSTYWDSSCVLCLKVSQVNFFFCFCSVFNIINRIMFSFACMCVRVCVWGGRRGGEEGGYVRKTHTRAHRHTHIPNKYVRSKKGKLEQCSSSIVRQHSSDRIPQFSSVLFLAIQQCWMLNMIHTDFIIIISSSSYGWNRIECVLSVD